MSGLLAAWLHHRQMQLQHYQNMEGSRAAVLPLCRHFFVHKRMMKKIIAALTLIWVAQNSLAAAPIWEVSDGKQKFWVGASLGALKKSAYPLPAEFDEAFRLADTLYVERDIHAVNQPDFGVRAMQASMYTDGRNLKSVLSAPVWQELEKFAQERRVPVFSLFMFKPAFASFTLTVVETKRLEFTNGVDAHYFYRARRMGKPIVALETVDQQIQFLQVINDADADALIKTTLDELKNLSATTQQATQSWRKGDMQALDEVKAKKLRTQAPKLYNELVVKRNQSWLPAFAGMLESEAVELVLIDAMHFTGPNNLLELFAEAGYTVKSYRPSVASSSITRNTPTGTATGATAAPAP